MKYFSSDYLQFKKEKNPFSNNYLPCSKRKNPISISTSSKQEEKNSNFEKLKISVNKIFQNAIETIESALFDFEYAKNGNLNVSIIFSYLILFLQHYIFDEVYAIYLDILKLNSQNFLQKNHLKKFIKEKLKIIKLDSYWKPFQPIFSKLFFELIYF